MKLLLEEVCIDWAQLNETKGVRQNDKQKTFLKSVVPEIGRFLTSESAKGRNMFLVKMLQAIGNPKTIPCSHEDI